MAQFQCGASDIVQARNLWHKWRETHKQAQRQLRTDKKEFINDTIAKANQASNAPKS